MIAYLSKQHIHGSSELQDECTFDACTISVDFCVQAQSLGSFLQDDRLVGLLHRKSNHEDNQGDEERCILSPSPALVLCNKASHDGPFSRQRIYQIISSRSVYSPQRGPRERRHQEHARRHSPLPWWKQVRIRPRAHGQRWTSRQTREESTHAHTSKALRKPCSKREEHEYRRRDQVHQLAAVAFAQWRSDHGTDADA